MLELVRFHHVQICIPIGQEDAAKDFYLGQLKFKEIPKPHSLVANGGFWLMAGNIEIHIGVEKMDRVTSKRHIALEVKDIEQARRYLEDRNVRIQEEKKIPGIRRFSFFDPFGNRIELLEKEASAPQNIRASVE